MIFVLSRKNDLGGSMILTFHGKSLASGMRFLDNQLQSLIQSYTEKIQKIESLGTACGIKLIIRQMGKLEFSVEFRHARTLHFFEIFLSNSELYSIDIT